MTSLLIDLEQGEDAAQKTEDDRRETDETDHPFQAVSQKIITDTEPDDSSDDRKDQRTDRKIKILFMTLCHIQPADVFPNQFIHPASFQCVLT